VLAEQASAIGAPLVHYSTDYVFDGNATTPCAEDATPRPLSEYGRSKLAGERAVLELGAASVVLRTSWVFGMRRRNFLTTIRPRYSVLDNGRVRAAFGITLPDWREQVERCLGEVSPSS